MAKRRFVKRKSIAARRSDPDYVLLAVIAFLTLFGWVMVYSSSVIVTFSQNKSSWYYFLKQLVWIILGTISGYILYRIDYKIFPKFASYLLAGSIFLLALVLFVGIEINGSIRWIRLPLFDLQPSEFTKLAYIIYLASWLSRESRVLKYKNALQNYLLVEMVPFLSILSVILILVLVEPDLGTTGTIGLVALAMFYLSGEGYIHNVGFSAVLITSLIVGAFAAILESYRIARIKTYLEVLKTGIPPDRYVSGYQLSQVLTAVGTGGVFGLGFGQSKQKFNYLGETAFSDTIFAVIAEEFGLLGAVVVTTCFLYIGMRGLKIAKTAPDKLSSLLAAGITIWILTQAFFNIAANVGLIPLTGIPLPFISYGGSSMIVILSGVGILLNVSRYAKLD